MNLPNTLTLVRIFFVPLLVAALVQEQYVLTLGGLRITNDWLALLFSSPPPPPISSMGTSRAAGGKSPP